MSIVVSHIRHNPSDPVLMWLTGSLGWVVPPCEVCGRNCCRIDIQGRISRKQEKDTANGIWSDPIRLSTGEQIRPDLSLALGTRVPIPTFEASIVRTPADPQVYLERK